MLDSAVAVAVCFFNRRVRASMLKKGLTSSLVWIRFALVKHMAIYSVFFAGPNGSALHMHDADWFVWLFLSSIILASFGSSGP